jgi:hypothetical protein
VDTSRKEVIQLSYGDMLAYLSDPETRIRDTRILEIFEEFREVLQVLGSDDKIRETSTNAIVSLLDLFKAQYRNNERNNPAVYGLLD